MGVGCLCVSGGGELGRGAIERGGWGGGGGRVGVHVCLCECDG